MAQAYNANKTEGGGISHIISYIVITSFILLTFNKMIPVDSDNLLICLSGRILNLIVLWNYLDVNTVQVNTILKVNL